MADIKLREITGKIEPNKEVFLKVTYNDDSEEYEESTFSDIEGNFVFRDVVLAGAKNGYVSYWFYYVNDLEQTITSKTIKKYIQTEGPEEGPVIVSPTENYEVGGSPAYITASQSLNVVGLGIPGNRIRVFNTAYDAMYSQVNFDTGIVVPVREDGTWEMSSIPLYSDGALEANDGLNALTFVQVDIHNQESADKPILTIVYKSDYVEEEAEEPGEIPLTRNFDLRIMKKEKKPANLVDLKWDKDKLGSEGLRILSHFDIWFTRKEIVEWRKHNKNPIKTEMYQVSGLEPATKYVFQLIAVSTDGRESYEHDSLGWNEVSTPDIPMPDRIEETTGRDFIKDEIAPREPYDLKVVRTKGSPFVQLTWNFFPEKDLKGFFIYESNVSPEDSIEFNKVGWGEEFPIDESGERKAFDSAIPYRPPYSGEEIIGNQMRVKLLAGEREGVYFYSIKAIDQSGNLSGFSEYKNAYIGEKDAQVILAPKPPEIVSVEAYKDIIEVNEIPEDVAAIKLTFKVIKEIGKYRIYRSEDNPSVVSAFQSWGEHKEVTIPEETLAVMPDGAVYEFVDRDNIFQSGESDGVGIGEHFYAVKVVSVVENEEYESDFSDYDSAEVTAEIAYPDREPPTEAGNASVVTSSAEGTIENEVKWTIGSDEDLKGYRIYRSKKNPADAGFVNPDSWEWEAGEDDEENSWKWLTREVGNEGVLNLPVIGDRIIYSDSNGLVNEQEYFYNIQAVDKFGNYSNKVVSVEVPPDNTYLEVLNPPADIFAFAGNSEIEVQWKNVPDLPPGSYYDLYRSETNPSNTVDFAEEGWEKINNQKIPQPTSGNYITYVDGQLVNTTTYYYSIKVKTLVGENESSYSKWVSATPETEAEIIDIPVAPKIESVEVTHYNDVEVKWEANLDENIKGYNVFRSEDHPGNYGFDHPEDNDDDGLMDLDALGSWTLLTRENEDVDIADSLVLNPSAGLECLFVDKKTNPDKLYYYVVHAIGNNNSVSLFSDVIAVYVPALVAPKTAPAEVAGLKTFNHTQGIQLKWQRNNNIAVDDGGYRVYRSKNNISPDSSDWEGWERLKIDVNQYNIRDDFSIPQTSSGLVVSYIDKEAIESGEVYYYTVTCVNKYGLESGYAHYSEREKIAAEEVDTTPPGKPEGARVIVLSNGTIKIKWKVGSESDLAGYNIYRSSLPATHPNFGDWGIELNGPLTYVEVVDGSSYISYVDSEVSVDERWYYAIEAVDDNGNVSERLESSFLNAKIPDEIDNIYPAQVKGLLTREESNRVVLSWNKVIYNEDLTSLNDFDGYIVYRSETNPSFPLTFSGWNPIELVPQVTVGSVVQYIDNDVQNNKRYYYTITAKDESANEGKYADYATAFPKAEPDVTPPEKPESLIAVVDGPQEVALTWGRNIVDGDLAGYNIYRSFINPDLPAFEEPDSGWIETGDWTKVNSDLIPNPDSGETVSFDVPENYLAAEQTYYFIVQARDTNNNISESSDYVSATTPALP